MVERRVMLLVLLALNIRSSILAESEIEEAEKPSEGTLWCGEYPPDDENALGKYEGTDKCCRAHIVDCSQIKPGEKKYGLENSQSFATSECSCDETLLTCLQAVEGEEVTKEVMNDFFHILSPPCFNFEDDEKTKAVWSDTKVKIEN